MKGVCIYALIPFVIMMLPLLSFAQKKGNISGSIQLTYQQDKVIRKSVQKVYAPGVDETLVSETTTKSRTARSLLTQDYRLQYQGFVYSPRLFMYTIGGSFRKDASKSETDADVSWTKTRSRDYNFRLNFIQGTKYPFTIYKEKFESQTLTMLPSETTLTRPITDRYGLLGNAFLGKGINLRYDIRQDNTKTIGHLGGSDKLSRNFLFGLDSRKEDKFIDMSYNYQHNLERQKGEFEAINDARISVGLKPGKSTNFNMDAGYNNNSLSEFTTISSNMRFNYNPSPDFSSNLSLYINNIEQKSGKGNFTTFFGNSTYKISQYFTANQNLMLYRQSGDFGNDGIQSLGLGLVFSKSVPQGLVFSADTSINGTMQQSETKDRNSMYYTIGGRVLKFFEEINSEVNAGGSYYFYSSSLGGRTNRYALNGGFSSRFIQGLTLQSILGYTEEETIGDKADSAPSSYSRTRALSSDNSLSYFIPIGFNGSLNLRVGANFVSGTTSRTFRYADFNFRYALMRNLSLNTSIGLYRESVNDTRVISGSLGVEYMYRGVRINFRDELWREKGPTGITTRSLMFLQTSRPF